jgi:hypothetical protein
VAQTETPATGMTDGGGEGVFPLLVVASQAERAVSVINEQKIIVHESDLVLCTSWQDEHST